MGRPEIEIKEIYDLAYSDPIDNIPHRSPHHQGQSELTVLVKTILGHQKIEHEGKREHCSKGQDKNPRTIIKVGKHPKRNARVKVQGKIKEAWDNLSNLTGSKGVEY
jgi:hypothetical protein